MVSRWLRKKVQRRAGEERGRSRPPKNKQEQARESRESTFQANRYTRLENLAWSHSVF